MRRAQVRNAVRRQQPKEQVPLQRYPLPGAVAAAAKGTDAEKTRAAAIAYSSALDRAVKSKVIHRNSASNHKSQYAKYIFVTKK